MKRISTTFLTIFVLGAFIASPLLTPQLEGADSGSSSAMMPKKAPAWSLKKLDGTTLKSSDLAGKVVILDFWATWCPPCRAEIPGFISLEKKYGDKGLVIVGASLDQAGVGVVKNFAKKMGINYSVVMADQETVAAFGGADYIPTTFVINRKGEIVAKHVGYTSPAEWEKTIKPLL